MASNLFDRSLEDIGNVVSLEHVNVQIPDQRLSTLFYISGLGLTRDPYLVTGVTNMWVNVGRSQFHLPTGDPLVVRGRIGLVLPDRKGLLDRLSHVSEPLQDTAFCFTPANDHVDVTCPWGNRFRCHEPQEQFGRVSLGIAYIAFDVPAGTVDGIARFYREILFAPSWKEEFDNAAAARVQVGYRQQLIFRETADPVPDFDGHHIQIYVSDFSGPYKKLETRGLISEESNAYQYRFETIFDPDSGDALYQLDHEIRSLTHPLYARPLVNRNPDQTNVDFSPGYHERSWAVSAPV